MSDHSISKLKRAARKLIKIDKRANYLRGHPYKEEDNIEAWAEIQREWEETMAELETAAQ